MTRSLVLLSIAQLAIHSVALPHADHSARGLLGLPDDPADLLGLVGGLVGSVASIVDLSNKRPDTAHPYQAPGPTDQRGPCPGLNLLANHGYLPRSGIITAGQAIEEAGKGFNMGVDVATFLATAQLVQAGNLETGVFSIGGEDNRTYSASGVGSRAAGRQWGLDAHSRIEVDASPTREDFFLNHGDNHSGSGSRFARFAQLAGAYGGRFSPEAANALYNQNVRLSLANNPRLSLTGLQFFGNLAVYSLIPFLFSNGTYEAGGVANYESISSILGFKFDQSTGTFCYVPERFPDNWYRRAIPYTFVDATKNLVPTYLAGPLDTPNPLGAVLTNPSQLPQLECLMYQNLFLATPASLAGSSVARITAALKYLQDNLLPIIPSTLVCPINLNASSGSATPQTQDSLQETRPGGGQAYNVCSA